MIPGNLLHFTAAPPGRAKAARPAQAQPKPAPRRAAEPMAAEDATGWRAARQAEARQVAGWLRTMKPKKATKPAAEVPTVAGLERAMAAENARQGRPIGFDAIGGVK